MTPARDTSPEFAQLRALIEKERYPLLGLRLEVDYLYAWELEKLLSLLQSSLYELHQEGIPVGRYPGTESASPNYLIWTIRSGSPLEILGPVGFLLPLVQESKAFLLSVGSSVVGAYIKDLLDKCKSLVSARREARPGGRLAELVEVLERNDRIWEGKMTHEEFDPNTGRLVQRTVVNIKTK